MKASAEPYKILNVLKDVDGVYIERQDKYEIFPIEKFEKKRAIRCPKGFIFIGEHFICPSVCCENCRDDAALGCELGAIIPTLPNCDCERFSCDCKQVQDVLARKRIQGRFENQVVMVLKSSL